jgi:hypothetical protein
MPKAKVQKSIFMNEIEDGFVTPDAMVFWKYW